MADDANIPQPHQVVQVAQATPQARRDQVSPEKALQDLFGAIRFQGDYYLQRNFCMDGSMSKFIDTQRAKGTTMPDVGAICLKLATHSADVEANPKAKAERVDQELLGPFKAILFDKGFNMTDAGAENVVKLYTEVGKQPNIRSMTFTSMPVQGKADKEWVFTPGSAFESAFVSTVQQHLKGQAVPRPTVTEASLAPTANACYKDANYQTTNGVKMGACTDAGEQAARHYVARKTAGATR
jgi:hypothetical protein